MKRKLLYALKWQTGSPLIAFILWFMANKVGSQNILLNTIIANIIGCIVFYPIDKKIFKNRSDTDEIKQ
jgi:hypothetical protein